MPTSSDAVNINVRVPGRSAREQIESVACLHEFDQELIRGAAEHRAATVVLVALEDLECTRITDLKRPRSNAANP